MADVTMVCDNGEFKGLAFTVPDKDPFVYEVIRGGVKVVYAEAARATREGRDEVTVRG